MNRVFERFRGGVARNRFGARVTQKLGADLNEVWHPLPPSCRHLPWHCWMRLKPWSPATCRSQAEVSSGTLEEPLYGGS